MDKLVQERLTLCSVVIGNIQFLKTQKPNNNKIPSLKIYNLTKIMQDSFPEQFFDCFNK